MVKLVSINRGKLRRCQKCLAYPFKYGLCSRHYTQKYIINTIPKNNLPVGVLFTQSNHPNRLENNTQEMKE